MKLATALALGATATGAWSYAIPQQEQEVLELPETHYEQQEKYLIELSPYQTRWVTEEEKWALKLVWCTGVPPSFGC
jgi:leucyl aminopeptidase